MVWKSKFNFQDYTKKHQKMAYEVYQKRLRLHQAGDEKSDWEEASRILQNSPLKRRLISICIWNSLRRASELSILLGVLVYVGSEKNRREAEVLNAWQVLTSAYGQSGNGGRIEALEFLNASPGANWRGRAPWICSRFFEFCRWPSKSLNGINLSSEAFSGIGMNNQQETIINDGEKRVYLASVALPKASLMYANFEGANLSSANLEASDLWRANLNRSILISANLESADLLGASLKGANLEKAMLRGADLGGANFTGASLGDANLVGANLSGASLARAFLGGANLAGADLGGANLEAAELFSANFEGTHLGETNLVNANLEGAENLTRTQVEQAKLCSTKLPEPFNLNSNDDCEELGVIPQ